MAIVFTRAAFAGVIIATETTPSITAIVVIRAMVRVGCSCTARSSFGEPTCCRPGGVFPPSIGPLHVRATFPEGVVSRYRAVGMVPSRVGDDQSSAHTVRLGP
jgi:hypothetical protein